jgi:hypothetical protein|tara:strand:- start:242 stop:352 length:111 start_codon:yes stop_codon:yes gene_type:complete
VERQLKEERELEREIEREEKTLKGSYSWHDADCTKF